MIMTHLLFTDTIFNKTIVLHFRIGVCLLWSFQSKDADVLIIRHPWWRDWELFLIKHCNAASINQSLKMIIHWFLLDFFISSVFSDFALVLMLLQWIPNLDFLSRITKDWLQKENLLMLYTKLDKKSVLGMDWCWIFVRTEISLVESLSILVIIIYLNPIPVTSSTPTCRWWGVVKLLLTLCQSS